MTLTEELEDERRLRKNAQIQVGTLGTKIDDAHAVLDACGIPPHAGNLAARIRRLAELAGLKS